MAGLSAAFGLKLQGIDHILNLDMGKNGYEGPWATFARMQTLRSPKDLVGPALGIPKLTFQAWYVAQYGKERWEELYKIPTPLWMDYLRWYRKVLKIHVENFTKVITIKPIADLIELTLEQGKKHYSRKVVLATGRDGFGFPDIPSFLDTVPKEFYAHTNDPIDFTKLKGKDVGILGCGASAFDAAAAALEGEAKTVTMLVRRKTLPNVNKFASTTYPGFSLGFYSLPDELKIKFFENAYDCGIPPPFESLDRVMNYPNFKVIKNVDIQKVDVHKFDYFILGTGYAINGSRKEELKEIYPDILLWKEKHPEIPKELSLFPYLGNHYQFQGKKNYLKNIYCFNYAACLTHGQTSGDIPDISTGAFRLTKGIVADFFQQDGDKYYQRFVDYLDPEFIESDYPFIV